jgi:hypothetical protein
VREAQSRFGIGRALRGAKRRQAAALQRNRVGRSDFDEMMTFERVYRQYGGLFLKANCNLFVINML